MKNDIIWKKYYKVKISLFNSNELKNEINTIKSMLEFTNNLKKWEIKDCIYKLNLLNKEIDQRKRNNKYERSTFA